MYIYKNIKLKNQMKQPLLLKVRYKEQRSEYMTSSTSHLGLRTLEINHPFSNFFPWVRLSEWGQKYHLRERNSLTLKWKQLNAFKLLYFVTVTLIYYITICNDGFIERSERVS